MSLYKNTVCKAAHNKLFYPIFLPADIKLVIVNYRLNYFLVACHQKRLTTLFYRITTTISQSELAVQSNNALRYLRKRRRAQEVPPANTRRGAWFSCPCCRNPSCSGTNAALISSCFMRTLLYFVSVHAGMWSMPFTRLGYCLCRGICPWALCTRITECCSKAYVFVTLGPLPVDQSLKCLARARWQGFDSQLKPAMQVLHQNTPFRNCQFVTVRPTLLKEYVHTVRPLWRNPQYNLVYMRP
jgi:hypothetical protein